MVTVQSQMLPLGTEAPDFELENVNPNVDADAVALSDFADQPLLVMFLCNHCPYVKHVRERLADVTRDYMERGVAVVGITSNDAEQYPDDSAEATAKECERVGYAFPYLFDGTQEVAKAYRAACTPDFYLFDADHALVYRGQFDATRPGGGQEATGEDLTAAVDAVLEGGEVPDEQAPSAGCNIKWRPGNAPDYFG